MFIQSFSDEDVNLTDLLESVKMTSSGLISEPKKASSPKPGSGPLGKSGPTTTAPSGGPVQSGARSPGIIYNFNYLLVFY